MITTTLLLSLLFQAGEDLGAAPEPHPLVNVRTHMNDAHARLKNGDISPETQRLQQQAIAELAQFIAQIERNQRSRSQTSASSRPSNANQSPANNEEESAPTGTDPSGMPTGGDPGGEAGGEEGPNAQSATDRAWGHLPERVRQQLQSAAIERFLPKYELLIEQYYQRLAEDAELNRQPTTPQP